MVNTEINAGEIKLIFDSNSAGAFHFNELGLTDGDLKVSGGNLRLVVELGSMSNHFFRVPTIEIAYEEKIGESSWQVEFNGQVVLDKTDHSGHRTVLLLDRSKLDGLKHRHENTLVVHGDLPSSIQINGRHSLLRLVEAPGS